MCLILLALRAHPKYQLVIAANRDEFYARPTAAAGLWEDSPWVLAGRDLVGGGTWLGVNGGGRFAAVSNFRDGREAPRPQAPSRGMLVAEYLTGAEPVTDYLSSVQARGGLYNGFNLIAGDLPTVSYGSNRTPSPRRLDAGIFGVSNHCLDTPWPKLERGKAGLRRLLSGHRALDIEALFALLADRSIPPDADLPDTGVGIEWERLLSPIFIESAHYGTRSSTVLLVDRAGRLTFVERSFEPGQEKFETRRFDIALGRGVCSATP
jgi:uncharacterized protein with NRDE domain